MTNKKKRKEKSKGSMNQIHPPFFLLCYCCWHLLRISIYQTNGYARSFSPKNKIMQEAREQWSWRGRESREDAPEEVMMDDGVWSDGVNSAIVWWIDKLVASYGVHFCLACEEANLHTGNHFIGPFFSSSSFLKIKFPICFSTVVHLSREGKR